jgi:CheY-like chemotaxis protein
LLETKPGSSRSNLVSNAIKFTPVGSVRVEASSLSRPAASGHEECLLTIAVTDSGIGLSSREKARLFQPFTQATPVTQLQFGGTGLGLTISKSLSELMGGTITVESTPGKGSTFMCSAKFRVGNREMLDKQDDPSAQNEDLAALKILVVDDQSLNRRLLQVMLARMKHEVELAPDGWSGLTLLKQTHFDVVIMDIEMLGMDGFETTRQIRLKEKDRVGATPVYIIALTAHASTDIRDQCFAAGMNDYLSKPITFSLLSQALRKAERSKSKGITV